MDLLPIIDKDPGIIAVCTTSCERREDNGFFASELENAKSTNDGAGRS